MWQIAKSVGLMLLAAACVAPKPSDCETNLRRNYLIIIDYIYQQLGVNQWPCLAGGTWGGCSEPQLTQAQQQLGQQLWNWQMGKIKAQPLPGARPEQYVYFSVYFIEVLEREQPAAKGKPEGPELYRLMGRAWAPDKIKSDKHLEWFADAVCNR
jgi:hypothetical protein